MSDISTAALLSLSTATPPFRIIQETFAERLVQALRLDDVSAQWLKALYKKSGIHSRHTVFKEFLDSPDRWDFWNSSALSPGTCARLELYKKEAPPLAAAAAAAALSDWGGDPKRISHLIFVSCTGMAAPGIQHQLRQQLSLSPEMNLIGLNFMGCFGVIKALDLARAYAMQSAEHRILIVSTELCSLHFQASNDPETHVTNSLFGDGASAAVVGSAPRAAERPLWTIEKSASHTHEATSGCMTWDVTDRGFKMGLTKDVPIHIGAAIAPFVERLVGEKYIKESYDWAVHPGGVGILSAVKKGLNLSDEQLSTSREVLKNFGNMSSSTFLFVLDALRKKSSGAQHAVGLGFGPGLTIEGLLLKRC